MDRFVVENLQSKALTTDAGISTHSLNNIVNNTAELSNIADITYSKGIINCDRNSWLFRCECQNQRETNIFLGRRWFSHSNDVTHSIRKSISERSSKLLEK